MKELHSYILENNFKEVIRIPDEEYGGFPKLDLFTHFNLETTSCEVGKSYVLPRIIRHGYIQEEGEEVLPLLSFENIYAGECLEVTNHLPYESLTPDDFVHSFKHIQNVEELKTYILKRYQKSKPNLTSEQILSRGVSRMLLRLGVMS